MATAIVMKEESAKATIYTEAIVSASKTPMS